MHLTSAGSWWDQAHDHGLITVPEPCTIRQIPASDLHPGQVLLDGTGHGRLIATARLQGAHPVVIVRYTGLPDRHVLPANLTVLIVDPTTERNQK